MSKKRLPQYEYNSSNNIVIVPTVSFKVPTPENNVPCVEKPINTDAKLETFKIPCIIQNNNICESVLNQDFNLNPTSSAPLFNNNNYYCPVDFVQKSSQFQSNNNFEWEYHNTPSISSLHTDYCTWNTPLPTYNTKHTRDVVLDQKFTSTVYNRVQSIDTMPLDSVHLTPTQSHQVAATKNIQVLHERSKSFQVKTISTYHVTNEETNKRELKAIKPANEKSLHEKDAETKPKQFKLEDRDKSKKDNRATRKSFSDPTNDSPIKTKSKSISIVSPTKIHNSKEKNCSLKPSKSDSSSKQIVCEECGVTQKTIDKRENFKNPSRRKSPKVNKIKKLSVELQKVKNEINKRKRDLIIKEILIQKEQQAINRAEQHKHTNSIEHKEIRANHLDKLSPFKNKINKSNQNDLKESSKLSKTMNKADATADLISKIKEIKNKYILKNKSATDKMSSNLPDNNTPVHLKSVVNVPEQYSLNNTVTQKKAIEYHTDKKSIFQNGPIKHITRTIERSKEKSQRQDGNSIAKCNIRYRNNNKFEGDRDDLVVMFNNENRKEDQLRERKVKLQRKRKREDESQKPVCCKKIKNIEFIINVVTEDSKPTTECEFHGDETDSKGDTSLGVDLSFLDDINVDEIAEYLKISHDVTKMDDNKTLESDSLENISLNDISNTNDVKELSSHSVFVTHFKSNTTQSNDKLRNLITKSENSSDTRNTYTETQKKVEKKQQEYNVNEGNHENEFDVELLMEQLFSDNAKQPPPAVTRNIMYANEKPVDVSDEQIVHQMKVNHKWDANNVQSESSGLNVKENELKRSIDKLKTSEISKQGSIDDFSSSGYDEFHMQSLKKTYEDERDEASVKYISKNEISISETQTKFISEGNKKHDKINKKFQKNIPGIYQTFTYSGKETRETSEVSKNNPYIDNEVHLVVAEPRNAKSKGSDDFSQMIFHKVSPENDYQSDTKSQNYSFDKMSKENEHEILVEHNSKNVIRILGSQTDTMKHDPKKEGVKDSDINPQPARSSVTTTRPCRDENKYFSQNSQIMCQDNAETDNDRYKKNQEHSLKKMSTEDHQQNSIVGEIMRTTSSITGKKEKHEKTEDSQIISEILKPLKTERKKYLNKTSSMPNHPGTTIKTVDLMFITDEANSFNETVIAQKGVETVDLLQRRGKVIDSSHVKIIEPILKTFDLTKEPVYFIHKTGEENNNSDVQIIEPILQTFDLTKQPDDLRYRTDEGNYSNDVKIIEPILETVDLTKQPVDLLHSIGEKNDNSNVKIIKPILETVDLTKELCTLKVSSLDSSPSLRISSASSKSFDEASVLEIHIGCEEMADLNIIDSVSNDNSDSNNGNNLAIPEIKSATDAKTKGKTEQILPNDNPNFSQGTVRSVNTNQFKEDTTFKNKAEICEKVVSADTQKIEENIPHNNKVISKIDAEKAFPLKFHSIDPRTLNRKKSCGVTLVRNMTERIFEYIHIKYIVNSIIHNGTYSQIFKCQDNSGNVIAAKVSKVDDAVRGYEREQMLMKVQDNIPREKLSCVYLINGLAIELKWCYLLEYYPKNLEQALKERGKSFHIDTVLHFAKQLVSAVVILRNNNIVHSDIKPSHILMDPNNRQIKLCGFDTAYYKEHMKMTGVVGTVHYRAPEAILGHSEGHTIDVWATALVLHEMATLQKLFPGSTNNEVLYQQMCVLGNIPPLMVQQSEFKKIHFHGNRFRREEPFEVITKFTKSAKLSTSVCEAYHRTWYHERNIIERRRDFVRQRDFCNLLNEMLVMDPAKRITIEFVYADPLIYS